ncbi:putative toxin-antitoxin system toxin component, PIN family [Caenispirillum salinarum]|uniref:PIN domain-containing protein n=1 Tax=Caenispirillum salinarum TaxID=859058 RepID=UPI00384C0A8C
MTADTETDNGRPAEGRADRPFGAEGEGPGGTEPVGVVLDTNVFVAAGFSPGSASGRIIDAVRRGTLTLVWNAATRRETERIVRKIPPLSRKPVADLFEGGYEYTGTVEPEAFNAIADPDDRKFAALAAAADVELVSQDDHLLSVAKCWPGRLRISSPPAFARRWKLRT